MTPELYTAIKDVLNYHRYDPSHGGSGYLGFKGGTDQCSRLKSLETAFTRHEPQKKTLVDTWVAIRNKALASESERRAFLPATSMVQVRRDPGTCFAEHVQEVVLPSLVDGLEDKRAVFSDIYSKSRSEFSQLDENCRAQAYLMPLEDLLQDLKQFWDEIGCNLAVDHLYIMVDSNNADNVAWHVVAVTRKPSAVSGPYEHTATLVGTPAIKATTPDLTPSTPDVLRGGVHVSGIDDATSMSTKTLFGAIISGITDPATRVSTVVQAVIAAVSPGIPLAALRDTRLLIVHEPGLHHLNVHDLVVENITNKKARIILSHVYCREAAAFKFNDPAGVLAVVLATPCHDLQEFYAKEVLGKQGVRHIHQLVLLIRSGKMNEWALAATLSEGVES